MASDWSVTEWIAQVKLGSGEAADRLFERYFGRVRSLVRHMLIGSPKRVADDEDVAASVFESFFMGAAEQRFDHLTDRDDLWCLLVAITQHKSTDQQRFFGAQKRGANRVIAASDLDERYGLPALDQLFGSDPTPAEIVELDDQLQSLMTHLRDDSLRNVARWRLARYSVAEIAEKLGITVRAVERKLQLIRESWSQELGHVG